MSVVALECPIVDGPVPEEPSKALAALALVAVADDQWSRPAVRAGRPAGHGTAPQPGS